MLHLQLVWVPPDVQYARRDDAPKDLELLPLRSAAAAHERPVRRVRATDR
jgi:hypothetical protein